MAEQGTADDLCKFDEMGQTQSKPILNEECVRVDAAEIFACCANAKGKADFLD